MSNQKLFQYIKLFREKAEQHKLVVFVGAGVSCNVEGMPDWKDLIQRMANAIGYSKCSTCRHKAENCERDCKFRNDFSTDEFLKIPQYVYNQNSSLYKKILLENILDVEADAPLSSAIFDINPAHIITTNYDHLLESSTNEFCEQYDVIIQDRDLLTAQKGKYIIKMHGDLSDCDNIVLKEQDYLNYSQSHTLIELFVKSLLTDHIVMFLGYSLNDYNIKLIISWINYMRIQNDAGTAPQKIGYIILDQEQVDETQRSYFKGNNIDVINIHKMPLIDKIPDLLKYEQGKRLYSFLRTIADASLEKNFSFITAAAQFMGRYTFVDYEKILQCLYIKPSDYEVLDWQLRLHSNLDYLRVFNFLKQDGIEATLLKQTFVNAGIFWIEYAGFRPNSQLITVGQPYENNLLQDKAFNLYLQNLYGELDALMESDSSNPIEKYFYKSILNGYSNAKMHYETINFTSLSLEQKVTYLHNQAVIHALDTYTFDSRRLEHFIQNITPNKDREMFSTYLDILDGSHRKRSEMQSALSKLRENVLSKTVVHFGSTSIFQIHKIKPLAMTQYFFYFFNHLFFKGFTDLPTFLQPYIEAIICANSEDVEVPAQWGGESFKDEKYCIKYIDVDIVTKFISTNDLYDLLAKYHVKRINIDSDGISFLVSCFENLCNSIRVSQTYGHNFSSIATLANLGILLNLIELQNEHLEQLENALANLFNDDRADRVLFSIRCPEYKSVLRSLSTLCKSLPHKGDVEIVRKIVTTQGFYQYAVNVSFGQLRSLILSFVPEQDANEIQNELHAVIESTKDFSYKAILLRLLYPRIIKQTVKDDYCKLLSTQFLQLETNAIYDFILSGWLAPTQEILEAFLNEILEMCRNKPEEIQYHPDPIEARLHCVYILYICDILVDISSLREISSGRPHLQFLLAPDAFDYSYVDFSDYMWVNFAKQKRYMSYFVAHKDIIVPRIRERLEKNLVNEDEKKILYRFLIDDDEIWKI